jgi:hypothetical protein
MRNMPVVCFVSKKTFGIPIVIPAKAGIQVHGLIPILPNVGVWIPAFAGMTM